MGTTTRTDEVSATDNAAARCTCCGAPLAAADSEWRLCERCYLERLAGAAPPHEADLYAGFVEALAGTLDLREHETGLHSRRVACHTQVLARRCNDDPAWLRQVYWGALLHDIGKIGVPDRILLKQGPLDAAEWAIMGRHPELGERIVRRLPGMDTAADVVLCHEERYDGRGYPRGLRADAIPLGARLFAVIDALDAITSDRPYRKGMDFAAAKAEILRSSGSQFDPAAVAAFLAEEETLRRMVASKCTQLQEAAESDSGAT